MYSTAHPSSPSIRKYGIRLLSGTCLLLLFLSPIVALSSDPYNLLSDSNILYKSSYSRSSLVLQQCSPYLGDPLSPSSPSPSDTKSAISHQLQFLNGAWQQVPGIAPLMPFMPLLSDSSSSFVTKEAQHLASLWITDVQLRDGAFSSLVNVSAVLRLGVSSDWELSQTMRGSSGFEIYPGLSLLTILMEGVYAEVHDSEERMLCLVGSSKLPSRGKNASVPWDWLDPTWNWATFLPSVSDDSKILAVFAFPKALSLTSRGVSGSLTSFHAPADSHYFDRVDFSSQLGTYSSYQFLSGDLVTAACAKAQSFPGELSRPQKFYQGNDFCTVFQGVVTNQWLDVLPNWNCSLSEEICKKLGPFSKDLASQYMDGGFNGTHLLAQDVRCVDYLEKDGSPAANVSAVFRAVLPSQSEYLAPVLSGLDGLTLAAEGKWSNISGQLCMIGCRRHTASTGEARKHQACNSKICIYIPLGLSLKKRSMLQGSISCILKKPDFYPLSFHLLHQPFFPTTVVGKVTYEYTKIREAGALLENFESIGFGDRIKKSLLKYPFAKGNLMALFEDLSFHSRAITTPNPSRLGQYVDFGILAIDERVGLDWIQLSNSSVSVLPSAVDDEIEKVKEQKYLYKIAAELRIKGVSGNKLSAVFAEGEYDPTVGKMYLIGCREVNAPWKTFQENAELLDDGMDCLIELTIEYPPTNARWLINPTVTLSVSSKRTKDDPLFFATMKLQTFPILYKSQREQIVSRKSLEGGLSILTLSLVLGCVLSQLIYIRSQPDSTPYISLLMLAVQAVGFSIPLITGMEAFFAKMSPSAEEMTETVLSESRWTWVIGYIVKLLTLAAFLLTLRIIQKVLKSRIRLGTRLPLEPWRVPSDKRVLAICCAIHVFGFVTVLIIHSIRIGQTTVNSPAFSQWNGSFHKQHDWRRVLHEYYGLVQDLFLLPQVVGNHLWETKAKPLRKLFYCGVTVLRLLPHLYDGLRPPDFNPYFADESQYANPSSDFYSKAGDIAIPVVAVLLALVVYIQQRWNGLKWEKFLQEGSYKFSRMTSKMYERLPSKTAEAEMVESVTVKSIPENDHDAVSSEH